MPIRLLTILLLTGMFSGNGRVNAQRTQSWVFGDSCYMEFTPNGPTLFPSIYTRYNEEMGSCISDENGGLLFYVTADSIYDNKNHPLSPLGIPNTLISNKSITQGTIILTTPGDVNKYEVLFLAFSRPVFGGPATGPGLYRRQVTDSGGNLTISEVDTLYFSDQGDLSEKLTATKHADGESWWVITHSTPGDNFFKFLFTPSGIQGPFIQSIGTVFDPPDGVGASVFSPQGDKYALVAWNALINLYDFDRCTGELSNFVDLGDTATNPKYHWMYGCSFSPDGTKLYASEIGTDGNDSIEYIQFNLNAPDIYGSRIEVISRIPLGSATGHHKLAPDGKIYVGHHKAIPNPGPFDNQLTVINNPNGLGAACNAVFGGFSLGNRRSTYQLPNHPHYELGPLMAQTAEISDDTLWICPGDSILLGDRADTTGGAVVYTWWPQSGLSTAGEAQTWASPGNTTKYYLSAEDTTLGITCTTTYDSVVVYVLGPQEFPVANAGTGGNLCLGDSLQLGTPDLSGGLWQYSWSPSVSISSDSTPMIWAFPAQPETYTLIVTNPRVTGIPGHCARDTASVTLFADPFRTHVPMADTIFCPGEFIEIGPTPQSGFTYRWTPIEWLDALTETPVQANPPETMQYILEIISDAAPRVAGCISVFDTITLETKCLYPNVVTPNGDGINDILDFGTHFSPPQLVIYDRWGHKVYQSDAYQNDWQAKNLPDGVYFYWLRERPGLKPRVGTVTVMR